MNLIYPAVFHKEDNAYWVEFPDLEGCQSYGSTLSETLLNAKEALEGYAVTLFEQGYKLPAPSDISSIKCEDGSFSTLVECDITNHLTKSRAVKKTLTIPSWLNDMAMREGVNFSGILQNALMEQLHLNQK